MFVNFSEVSSGFFPIFTASLYLTGKSLYKITTTFVGTENLNERCTQWKEASNEIDSFSFFSKKLKVISGTDSLPVRIHSLLEGIASFGVAMTCLHVYYEWRPYEFSRVFPFLNQQ